MDVCKTRDIFLTLTLISNFQYPLFFSCITKRQEHEPRGARTIPLHVVQKVSCSACSHGRQNYTDHNYHCHAKGDWQSQIPWQLKILSENLNWFQFVTRGLLQFLQFQQNKEVIGIWLIQQQYHLDDLPAQVCSLAGHNQEKFGTFQVAITMPFLFLSFFLNVFGVYFAESVTFLV